jgi:hypothetical protein
MRKADGCALTAALSERVAEGLDRHPDVAYEDATAEGVVLLVTHDADQEELSAEEHERPEPGHVLHRNAAQHRTLVKSPELATALLNLQPEPKSGLRPDEAPEGLLVPPRANKLRRNSQRVGAVP